jgi:phytoene dehydrogenase-like protein
VSRYAYLVSLLPPLIPKELGLPLRLARRSVSSYTPDPRVGGRRGLLVDERVAATSGSFRSVTRGNRAHAAWKSLRASTRRIAEAVFPTLTEPLRSRDELRALVGDDAAWSAVFETPLGESILPALGDDLVAGVVLTDALIGTFASAGDPGLRQNRCFLYHVIGGGTGDWLVPIGGMGALTDALDGAARACGADMRTDTEVLRIGSDADGADVCFTDGADEHVVRARHVLVNAAPAELDRLLGVESVAARRPEGAQLKVNLLLSRLPRLNDNSTSPALAFAGTFHVNETAGQLQRAYDEAAAGSIPALPPCEAYCHSLSDPTILGPWLRSSGAQTLTVFVLHMPARLFAAEPAAARDAALSATMRSLDSVLAEPLANCLARGGDGKPCLQVHSPLDIETELRMPGGHIFHRDLRWPFAECDQELGTWGVETAHPSVLLCGAGARRGGGVSGIAGRNAAMAVLSSKSP